MKVFVVLGTAAPDGVPVDWIEGIFKEYISAEILRSDLQNDNDNKDSSVYEDCHFRVEEFELE